MARYIDAEHLTYRILSEITVSENGYAYAAAVQDRIKEEPTADVAPVVHALWMVDKNYRFLIYNCSNCDFCTTHYYYNYCPNCGAKMEGVTE